MNKMNIQELSKKPLKELNELENFHASKYDFKGKNSVDDLTEEEKEHYFAVLEIMGAKSYKYFGGEGPTQ